MRIGAIVLALTVLAGMCYAQEGRILRYPHYHGGTAVFSYMGDLWTVMEDGSALKRLTAHPKRDLAPQFSPDGKHVAFSSNRHGGYDVYVMPTEGGTAKRLTKHSGSDFLVGWTPDGTELIFVSARRPGYNSHLYTIPFEGGPAREMGIGSARRGTFSPDGGRMVFNRKGFRTWRKKYRGSANTDLWIVDLNTKEFTRLTDFEGQDAWPMWASREEIYFASDRSGAMNIWRISPDGGEPVQMTRHEYPGIKYPSISWDRKTIIYEHKSGLWIMSVPDGATREIKLLLPVDHKGNERVWLRFANRMDGFSTDSAGKHVAFSIRGELFRAPVAKGDLIRLTKGEARDRMPAYSPDGKKVAYISDESGEEKIYVVDAKGGEPEVIEPAGNVHYNLMWSWGGILLWSPDSKKLVYGAGNKLFVYDFDRKATTAEIEGIRGTIIHPNWAPDNRWLAYSRRTQELQFDAFALNIEEGTEYRLTDDPRNDYGPTFTPDGKGLIFSSNRSGSYQFYHFPFDKREYDPSDPEEVRMAAERKKKKAEAEKAAKELHGKGLDDIVITDLTEPEKPEIERKAGEPGEKSSAKNVLINMDNLKQRIRRATNVKGDVKIGPLVQKDGKRFIFVAREVKGNSSLDVVYSAAIVPTGVPAADLRQLTSSSSIRALELALDGNRLFLLEGSTLSYMSAKGGAKKPIHYSVRTEIDRKAEREQIFGEVWRALRDGFYDERMHGSDWEAVRKDYGRLLDYVDDREELAYVINDMLGEINASHMGYSYPVSHPDADTRGLGIEIKADNGAGLYRVEYIYPEGPADKDYIDIRVDDYVLEIDGVSVTVRDNLSENLTNPLNPKVTLLVNDKPEKEGARTVRIRHISRRTQGALWYKDWVRKNREYVEEKSVGRVGYLHIKGMNSPAVEQFKRDILGSAGKDALIIDVRWNGGGNAEQQLLDILERRRYQRWVPRDIGEEFRPHEGFFGPKAVLINQSSASNAEMFPAGFRELGLGRIIGVPTAGAISVCTQRRTTRRHSRAESQKKLR